MELNFDCVRDVMLFIEKNLYVKCGVVFEQFDLRTFLADPDFAESYTKDELVYTLMQLRDAGFLRFTELKFKEGRVIQFKGDDGITFQGHCFLETIKADAHWVKIKDQAKKIGCATVGALATVALDFIKAKVSDLFG